MPIYEYKCELCGNVFEKRQKFSDEPLAAHPGCGGHVHRLISPPALQFKGSGWYVTDYGKSGTSPAPSNNGGREAGASSDSSPKTDSGTSTAAPTTTTETKTP